MLRSRARRGRSGAIRPTGTDDVDLPTPSSVDALLEAALADVRDRRLPQARDRLVAVGAKLEAERVPADDPRRGDAGAMLGHVLRLLGDREGAHALLLRVMAESQRHGWHGSATRAAIQLGWLIRSQGDTAAGERWMRDATHLADRAGPEEIVAAYTALAEVLALHGDRAGAEQALDVATEHARDDAQQFRVELTRANLSDRHGRPDEAERALRAAARLAQGEAGAFEVALLRAKVALGRGEDAQALRHARKAARLAVGWGSDVVQASARMLLGEVARSMKLTDEAERAYQAAEALYGDTLSARIARLNRAMVAVERGDAEGGEALARPMVHGFPGNPVAGAAALLCTIPAAAARRELSAVAAALGEVHGRLWSSGSVHRDIASLAAAAAEALAEVGQPELAIRAMALAHDQWRRLGNAEQLARASERLVTLRAAGAPIPLRGFLLDAVIGEGAQGTVWRARHATSGELVAIKVLRGGPAVTATVRSMFARELRAVAGLDHPNVVWLLDHGWVDDAAAVVEPRLEIDAPFLALEYGTLGTLDARCGRLTWAEVLPIVLGVVDGLAHAHARGLLHLDLKPTNVLLAGEFEAPTPKLADFGLARAPAPGRPLRTTGTPAYMAPEQFGNDAGALGPWTDLYAVGCLLTATLTGAPPFGLSGAAQLRDAHLNKRPPPLAPSTPVPVGLYAIVDKLLAKTPADRFGSAAELARALASLGPDLPGASSPPRGTGTTVLAPVVEAAVTAEIERIVDLPAPFPARWDVRAASPRDTGLVAAGLGLVSLRRPRTVGRELERAELWSALREAVATRCGGAVVVTGEPGMGARHLVRWLAERAHELGAARGLLMSASSPRLAATSPAAIAQELERMAASRPLVVGLLHAHEMPHAAAVLAGAQRARAPVLCVATVPAPVPAGLRLPVPIVRLGPVSDATLHEMVATLLPLAPALVGPLCARAEGVPGRALERVRRLAEDRQLVPVDAGWGLRPSADLEDVLAPIRSRQRLASLAEADREALRVLEQLGDATLETWTEACRQARVADVERALERLARTAWVDADGPRLRLGDGLR